MKDRGSPHSERSGAGVRPLWAESDDREGSAQGGEDPVLPPRQPGQESAKSVHLASPAYAVCGIRTETYRDPRLNHIAAYAINNTRIAGTSPQGLGSNFASLTNREAFLRIKLEKEIG